MSHELSSEAMRHAQEEFRRALDASAMPYKMGQLELFSDEEENFIANEVERKLYKPKLPNAGDRERLWLDKLKAFSRDDSLVITIKASAGRYATALESLLPRRQYIRSYRPAKSKAKVEDHTQPDDEDVIEGDGKRTAKWLTLPGCYYTRKPVTPKTNKSLYQACKTLKEEAGKDMDKKWLAQFLLDGEPEAVSNFKMECLYLLRGDDGNVTRLVRLVNTVGETSEGPEIGRTDILPAELFASAEKFRAWCQLKGNFCWGVGGGAGNIELQMLHRDVANNAAYKVAKLIQYCGWHPVKDGQHHEGLVDGLWFYDECAFTSTGELLLPDDDGVISYNGEIFVLGRKGREADFAHGRPKMRPNELLPDGAKMPWVKQVLPVTIKLDKSEWKPDSLEMPSLAGFFREMCRRFYDTAGGIGGWMMVGAMAGYAVAPEFFERNGCLPSGFAPGQMGSGKTVFCNWLMGIQGYDDAKGLGLGQGSRVTPVGLCQQLENYSNLALWFDEYREYEISKEKVSIIRDSYDRQLAGKWTPDGVQRVIRTTPLVSGETDTRDSATRSRYCHQQISATQRLANHLNWMRDNRKYFFLFWREIMRRRPEFVELVMKLSASWFASDYTSHIPERSRMTHSLPYAAFIAATQLFESHGSDEINSFRKFMIEQAAHAAEDVAHEVNVNVYMQDMVTIFKAGEIPAWLFRVEGERVEYPPGSPNQGHWTAYKLFWEPKGVNMHMQEALRRSNSSITLTYNDLRDQLSKLPGWIHPKPGQKLNKRFGKKGEKSTETAWGVYVDGHTLGTRTISDEDFKASLSDRQPTLGEIGPIFEDGDPRKGPLFVIIEGVLKYNARQEQEDSSQS